MNNIYKKAICIILVSVFLFVIVPGTSFAQAPDIIPGIWDDTDCNQSGADPCDFCDLIIVSNNIYQILVALALILGSIFIIAGGIILVSGAFSQKWHQLGKNAITWAIIGVAIAILSWVIVNTVFWVLAGDNYQGWGTIDCSVLDFLTEAPGTVTGPTGPTDPTDPGDEEDEEEIAPTDFLRQDCGEASGAGFSPPEYGCLLISAFTEGDTEFSNPLSISMLWSGGPTGSDPGRESGNANTTFALVTDETITVSVSALPEDGSGNDFAGWSFGGFGSICSASGISLECTYGPGDWQVSATAWYEEGEVAQECIQEFGSVSRVTDTCPDINNCVLANEELSDVFDGFGCESMGGECYVTPQTAGRTRTVMNQFETNSAGLGCGAITLTSSIQGPSGPSVSRCHQENEGGEGGSGACIDIVFANESNECRQAFRDAAESSGVVWRFIDEAMCPEYGGATFHVDF